MDINDLRSLYTVLVFAVFAGIVWWAYSARRKSSFDEAAQLPFDHDDLPASAQSGNADQRDN